MIPACPFVMQLPSFGRRWLAFIDYAFEFIFMKRRRAQNVAALIMNINFSWASGAATPRYIPVLAGIRAACSKFFLLCGYTFRGFFLRRRNRSTLRSEYQTLRKMRTFLSHYYFFHLMCSLALVFIFITISAIQQLTKIKANASIYCLLHLNRAYYSDLSMFINEIILAMYVYSCFCMKTTANVEPTHATTLCGTRFRRFATD